MSRHGQNPQPARSPEFLERRLHPTMMIPLAADIASVSMDDPEPLPPDVPGCPPPIPPAPLPIPILPG